MNTSYLCTFDVGTTGVKAGILSSDGQLLATAYREYSVMHPHSLWSEQSVNEIWKAQCEASREVIAKASIKPSAIAAVGVSCQRATFVPLDDQERPLTNSSAGRTSAALRNARP